MVLAELRLGEALHAQRRVSPTEAPSTVIRLRAVAAMAALWECAVAPESPKAVRAAVAVVGGLLFRDFALAIGGTRLGAGAKGSFAVTGLPLDLGGGRSPTSPRGPAQGEAFSALPSGLDEDEDEDDEDEDDEDEEEGLEAKIGGTGELCWRITSRAVLGRKRERAAALAAAKHEAEAERQRQEEATRPLNAAESEGQSLSLLRRAEDGVARVGMLVAQYQRLPPTEQTAFGEAAAGTGWSSLPLIRRELAAFLERSEQRASRLTHVQEAARGVANRLETARSDAGSVATGAEGRAAGGGATRSPSAAGSTGHSSSSRPSRNLVMSGAASVLQSRERGSVAGSHATSRGAMSTLASQTARLALRERDPQLADKAFRRLRLLESEHDTANRTAKYETARADRLQRQLEVVRAQLAQARRELLRPLAMDKGCQTTQTDQAAAAPGSGAGASPPAAGGGAAAIGSLLPGAPPAASQWGQEAFAAGARWFWVPLPRALRGGAGAPKMAPMLLPPGVEPPEAMGMVAASVGAVPPDAGASPAPAGGSSGAAAGGLFQGRPGNEGPPAPPKPDAGIVWQGPPATGKAGLGVGSSGRMLPRMGAAGPVFANTRLRVAKAMLLGQLQREAADAGVDPTTITLEAAPIKAAMQRLAEEQVAGSFRESVRGAAGQAAAGAGDEQKRAAGKSSALGAMASRLVEVSEGANEDDEEDEDEDDDHEATEEEEEQEVEAVPAVQASMPLMPWSVDSLPRPPSIAPVAQVGDESASDGYDIPPDVARGRAVDVTERSDHELRQGASAGAAGGPARAAPPPAWTAAGPRSAAGPEMSLALRTSGTASSKSVFTPHPKDRPHAPEPRSGSPGHRRGCSDSMDASGMLGAPSDPSKSFHTGVTAPAAPVAAAGGAATGQLSQVQRTAPPPGSVAAPANSAGRAISSHAAKAGSSLGPTSTSGQSSAGAQSGPGGGAVLAATGVLAGKGAGTTADVATAIARSPMPGDPGVMDITGGDDRDSIASRSTRPDAAAGLPAGGGGGGLEHSAVEGGGDGAAGAGPNGSEDDEGSLEPNEDVVGATDHLPGSGAGHASALPLFQPPDAKPVVASALGPDATMVAASRAPVTSQSPTLSNSERDTGAAAAAAAAAAVGLPPGMAAAAAAGPPPRVKPHAPEAPPAAQPLGSHRFAPRPYRPLAPRGSSPLPAPPEKQSPTVMGRGAGALASGAQVSPLLGAGKPEAFGGERIGRSVSPLPGPSKQQGLSLLSALAGAAGMDKDDALPPGGGSGRARRGGLSTEEALAAASRRVLTAVDGSTARIDRMRALPPRPGTPSRGLLVGTTTMQRPLGGIWSDQPSIRSLFTLAPEEPASVAEGDEDADEDGEGSDGAAAAADGGAGARAGAAAAKPRADGAGEPAEEGEGPDTMFGVAAAADIAETATAARPGAKGAPAAQAGDAPPGASPAGPDAKPGATAGEQGALAAGGAAAASPPPGESGRAGRASPERGSPSKAAAAQGGEAAGAGSPPATKGDASGAAVAADAAQEGEAAAPTGPARLRSLLRRARDLTGGSPRPTRKRRKADPLETKLASPDTQAEVNMTIAGVFSSKLRSDRSDDREGKRRAEFRGFVATFFNRQYGLKKLAAKQRVFLRKAVVAFCDISPRCRIFACLAAYPGSDFTPRLAVELFEPSAAAARRSVTMREAYDKAREADKLLRKGKSAEASKKKKKGAKKRGEEGSSDEEEDDDEDDEDGDDEDGDGDEEADGDAAGKSDDAEVASALLAELSDPEARNALGQRKLTWLDDALRQMRNSGVERAVLAGETADLEDDGTGASAEQYISHPLTSGLWCDFFLYAVQRVLEIVPTAGGSTAAAKDNVKERLGVGRLEGQHRDMITASLGHASAVLNDLFPSDVKSGAFLRLRQALGMADGDGAGDDAAADAGPRQRVDVDSLLEFVAHLWHLEHIKDTRRLLQLFRMLAPPPAADAAGAAPPGAAARAAAASPAEGEHAAEPCTDLKGFTRIISSFDRDFAASAPRVTELFVRACTFDPVLAPEGRTSPPGEAPAKKSPIKRAADKRKKGASSRTGTVHFSAEAIASMRMRPADFVTAVLMQRQVVRVDFLKSAHAIMQRASGVETTRLLEKLAAQHPLMQWAEGKVRALMKEADGSALVPSS
ncbi:hypothetical protein FNF29_04376 [Cafeteria roenbergensis]|uniref:Uncharacterized protein n=3 Tax=Cafeteria roenbergensis TaxID=33653 RepID=A0A5A8CHU4_CAFRO|nr:hypothetical protein FNF29_04376 [Cafeteria roenbergensis]|eukprot:KAA0151690.1 hypothetical protein FNF29_04376 [Cafeteria roenbergensis]